MSKYTAEFERYWGRTDHAAYGNAPYWLQERIKYAAFKAWLAARRPRTPVPKQRIKGVPF